MDGMFDLFSPLWMSLSVLFGIAALYVGYTRRPKYRPHEYSEKKTSDTPEIDTEKTSDPDNTLKHLFDIKPKLIEEKISSRELELLKRIDKLETGNREHGRSLLRAIGSIASNVILLFGTIGGAALLILIIASLSPIEHLKALFGSDIYWGGGLPECSSSYAAEQTRKKFVEIPLVAMTRSFPDELVDTREISSTENRRDCRAVMKTTNGRSVGIKFTFERSKRMDEFFFTVEILDPSGLLP